MSSTDWLPLCPSSHLRLKQFSNCYSTTSLLLPQLTLNSPAAHSVVTPPPPTSHQTYTSPPSLPSPQASVRSNKTTTTTPFRPHLLVATSNELLILRHLVHDDPSSLEVASEYARATALALKARSNGAPANDPTSATWLESLPLPKLPLQGVEIIAVHAFNAGEERRPIVCVAAGIAKPSATAAAAAAMAAAAASGTATPTQQASSSSAASSSQQAAAAAAAQNSKANLAHAPIPSRFVLNIYGLHCPLTSDMHAIMHDCTSIPLQFVPFVLTSTTLLRNSNNNGNSNTPDILLSGSDRNVHVFRQAKDGSYTEVSLLSPAHPLPMLLNTPSAVLSLDIAATGPTAQTSPHTREAIRSSVLAQQTTTTTTTTPTMLKKEHEKNLVWIAAGFQDGLVRLVRINTALAAPESHRRFDSSSSSNGDQHINEEKEKIKHEQEEGEGRNEGAVKKEEAEEEAEGNPWQLGHDDAEVTDEKATEQEKSSSSASSVTAKASSASSSKETRFRWNDFYLDGPISAAKIFCSSASFNASVLHSPNWTPQSTFDTPLHQLQTRAQTALKSADNATEEEELELKLFLGNAVGFGVVYTNLNTTSLTFANSFFLNGTGCMPSSTFSQMLDALTDSILCIHVADLNMDGRMELMLGTYSGLLLVFQEETADDVVVSSAATNLLAASQTSNSSSGMTALALQRQLSSNSTSQSSARGYKLAARKQFSHPIYSISSIDLSGHGMEELIVTTMYSVEVWSWEVESAVDMLTNKLECLEEIRQLEAAVEQMKAAQKQQQSAAKGETVFDINRTA